ncbi:DUF4435 domain-containing protein [Ruthenibacterium lactatiformans]|uniref:DUF4435 domain-containing protein n=1 Tax=Ruthenibacterium lactatiformans TaxID=1550024 RepID=UPI003080A98B
MAFTYYLPDENGNKVEYGTSSNAVIIIGANGSGKSKLGAWIEQHDFENVHRIGAQRNLNFNENIPLKSYSQAEDLVFYGTADSTSGWKKQKGLRWNYGKSYTTTMMSDFENVLAALIALTNVQNTEFIAECKKCEADQREKPHTPHTAIDQLIEIWDTILPQRKLKYYDGRFSAVLPSGDDSNEYSSNQMSDGERAVLYLAAQVLCVPANKTLIIDEPEIHLHRSIMNRLWSALESFRPDCLFIYITHDTQFAAAHGQSDIIWIKEFDGTHWKLEKPEDNELPEELLFDILGSRKNVLFVEGEKNSYDTQLYTVLYPNYYVIACGSCTQVISRTKAFRNSPSLHHCQVYGLIDRDYRSDHEIEKYKDDGIYTLKVAEVENLFLVEELIRLMADRLGQNPDDIFAKVKDYIIHIRFAHQIDKQICQSVVAHLKYQLAAAELSKKNDDEAKNSLDAVLKAIDYEKTKAEQEAKFKEALSEDDYAKVLRVFNEKGLISSIGHFLGVVDKEYCNRVLALLNGKLHGEISDAISGYLPPEIPR